MLGWQQLLFLGENNNSLDNTWPNMIFPGFEVIDIITSHVLDFTSNLAKTIQFNLIIFSCLEEGAEEFLLKPVKLSDVKRVTDFIMRGEGMKGGKRSQKRRRSVDCIPSLTTELSPLSPSTLASKKSKL
ncbi:hypothetical protein Ahy_B05g076162 isoform C [Arachis hypogaea]|uniref:Response regulatory domain-containing protein n=1 Tax=Arachis hypogaea TaxID=3818 RepID=A0A444Z337_ARAHY|nr:hypothetical protein Ahy_B05g076162 isoform C [Arachis hypogaea]